MSVHHPIPSLDSTWYNYKLFCQYMLDKYNKEHQQKEKCFLNTGLCGNLGLWNAQYPDKIVPEEWQRSLFNARGLHSRYPFNDGDSSQYHKEFQSGTLYGNPHRLNWLKRFSDPASI